MEYHDKWGNASVALNWAIDVDDEQTMFQKAIHAAATSDVAVVVAGIFEGEGKDRAILNLDQRLEDLICAVAETGTPTTVVLLNGSAVTMSAWVDSVDALLEAWYPGEEGGNAVAEVLFGQINPGGKLPITFPVHVGQCPLYYNYKPSGRGYDYGDTPGSPQFPFGHGLSYSEFQYKNLQISNTEITQEQNVTISVTVRNVSALPGDEVVQLYLHDVAASTVQPLKSLKDFRRVHIKADEEKNISFELKPNDLAIYDRDMNYVVEPGEFEIMIGSSSEDIQLQSTLTVVEE